MIGEKSTSYSYICKTRGMTYSLVTIVMIVVIYNHFIRVASYGKTLDVLNIWLIINRAFFEACNAIFNPRNNMYISHNNGLADQDLCVQKDTVINANTLLWLGRKSKRKGEKERVAKLKAIVAQHAV